MGLWKRFRHGRTAVVVLGSVLSTVLTVATLHTVNLSAHRPAAIGASNSLYGVVDLLDFLMFASGPVAHDHPALVPAAPATAGGIPVSADRTHRAAQLMADCFETQDPGFASIIPASLQSGDPYRVEQAVDRIRTDVQSWMTKAPVPRGVCAVPAPPPSPDPGTGGGWWYLTSTVAAQGLLAAELSVVAVAAVDAIAGFHATVLVTVWAVLVQTGVAFTTAFLAVEFLYEHHQGYSQFDSDESIARIATSLKYEHANR
jgi:SdpC family antimicrobial peptide